MESMQTEKSRGSQFGFRRIFKDRSLLVDILSIVYGLGSWIAMTGLWVELPLLVHRLPEGWSLGSSLTFTLQAANIGPVVYGVLRKKYPKIVTERCGTHAQLLIGSVSTFLLIFFWSSTVAIGSTRISLFLYILAFGLSIVDCTSSVVFLPYMAFFRSIYLVPYLLGEGLSGLLPSLVAAAQGVGEEECHNLTVVDTANSTGNRTILVPLIGEPRFEPEYFFVFLFVMVLMSWGAFILLDKLEICRREMVTETCVETQIEEETLKLRSMANHRMDDVEVAGNSAEENFLPGKQIENVRHNPRDDVVVKIVSPPSKIVYFYLLSIQGWACIATFGVFPAIQPYSCLPYGNEPFHYAVTLGGAAYPLACFVALFYESRSLLRISILTTIANAISIFILYTAVTSPRPPLFRSAAGPPVIVVCWVAFIGLFSYVKTMVTVLLGESWGNNGLFWCGAVTQAGAALGAFLMFILISILDLFEDEQLCGT